MIRIAIKDLLGRKLRLALTSLAIVMGVAMVSGTYVLTDTIDSAFSAIFTTAYSTSDAVITGKAAFGGTQNAPSFPESTLAKVRALPAVSEAAGGIGDLAQFVGRNGKVLSHGGAPGLAFSVNPTGDQHFNPLTLLGGTWPRGAHEVAIDSTVASDLHIKVGGTVGILPRGGKELRFKVSGIAEFGSSTTLGGATLAIFDLPTAQQLFHKQGELDQIDVAVKRGFSIPTLLSQIRSVLPPNTQVRTSQQQAKQASSDTSAALSFLRYFLLAFGGIALFVGAFVIANTLSITIAQRTREFATLRAMGATGRQVIAVVVAEGFVTGLFASVVGLFVGLGLAKGLDQLFKAFGADSAAERPGLRHADDRRLGGAGHRCDPGREHPPGSASNPGAPDRGRPGGLDPAAFPLRTLRPARGTRRLRGFGRACRLWRVRPWHDRRPPAGAARGRGASGSSSASR